MIVEVSWWRKMGRTQNRPVLKSGSGKKIWVWTDGTVRCGHVVHLRHELDERAKQRKRKKAAFPAGSQNDYEVRTCVLGGYYLIFPKCVFVRGKGLDFLEVQYLTTITFKFFFTATRHFCVTSCSFFLGERIIFTFSMFNCLRSLIHLPSHSWLSWPLVYLFKNKMIDSNFIRVSK